MEFEWARAKSDANLKKHGIGIDDAKHILDGPILTRADDQHDYGETRYVSIGALCPIAVLVVVHTERAKLGRSWPERPTGRKERGTMPISRKRLKEIEAMKDEDIDHSDIPEFEESFWANAKLVEPDTTQHVTLRIKKSVLEHFKAKGAKGYQTRINAVLESYVRAQRQKDRSQQRNR